MATVVNGYTLEPNVNLAGADLMYADLEYVNLSYSYMADVNLSWANLRYSNLTGANLNRANLDWSIIEYADLSSSFLFEASLHRASLFGTDLTYADLSGANLTGANLTEVDLSHAQLNDVIMFSTDFGGVNLSGANLTDADLTSADMTEANLVGANLTDADLTSVDLTGADLTGAILTGVDLTYTDLTGADLTGADLTGVDLSSADLNQLRSSEIIGIPVLPTGYTLTDGYIIGPNIDLSNADIGEVDFSGANLKGANLYDTTLYGDMSGYNPALYGAKLSNTDFTGANLTYATLSYADLTGAILTDLTYTNLTRADLTGANLTGAVVTGTSFLQANLTGADLTGAILTGPNNLTYTDLTGADLTGAQVSADLAGADLTGADLTDTSLSVNLTGADLTGVDLSSADLGRIMSSGIIGIPILPTGFTLVEGFDWDGKEPSGYIVGPNVGISWGNLSGTDLTGADLTAADLTGTNFTGVKLSGANLTNATLTVTKFVNANLTDSNLTGANLRDSNLTGADLSGANLTLSNLESAKLDGADLTGANLTSAYLKDADLTIADLTGIISGSIAGTPILPASYSVVNGYIVGANVNLIDADLTGADLTDAVLTGADLSGADLSNANLTGADLTGADLTGTNVNGATGLEVLSQEQLDVTIVNNLPSGAVTIDGTASQGNDLTAVTTALADEDGLGTLSYQWTANGIDISSATDRILTLGQSEVGKEITVSVSYTDDGGTAETMSSAATSAVTNVNDAPTITTTTILSTDEDTSIAAIAFSGADIDGDNLTFSFSNPANGTVTDNNDGTFSYTPNANVNGTDSFTITANDGTVDVTETVNVAIAAVNDAPTISTTSTFLTTDEDTASEAIEFSGSDADGDSLTYTFSDPIKGSVVDNGDGTFTYTPDSNENGLDSFIITVSDGIVSTAKTIDISIASVNDSPTFSSSAVTTINEDASYSYTFTASDVDAGDTVTLSAQTKPDWLSFDAGTGVLSGTPTNDTVGDHSVVLRATDGAGAYVEQSFTVSGSNRAINISVAEDLPTDLALEFVGSSGTSKTATVDNGAFEYSNVGTFSHVVLESSTYNADITISDVISSLKHIVGLETLDGTALHAADVDNDDTVAIADVISQLKHIVGLETLNTFDLVNTAGARVTEITEATTDLQLVLNGDVDLSTTLTSEYAVI